jgi:hypothetical protein
MVVWLGALTACTALAQQGEGRKPVPAAEACRLIGTNAVMVGRVAEVQATGQTILLHLEEKAPKQSMTVVVNAPESKGFTNLQALAGKMVVVSGKVVDWLGGPAMVLGTNEQLKVLPATRPLPPTRLRIVPDR